MEKPPRARTSYLKRYILPSDGHSFIGRIYDLSIVSLHFDSYEAMAIHADCKYALEVNYDLSNLTRRVESLNLAGEMLWPKSLPTDFKQFPVSRYEWLTISADVFLMRYVSAFDCLLLVIGAVYETGLHARQCTYVNLSRKLKATKIIAVLEGILETERELRSERNSRFHHGEERGFTTDDQTFRTLALWEHRFNGMIGTDRFGRKANLDRSFKEGLVELQRDFNRATRELIRGLDKAYSLLSPEFETRFVPKFRAATHGLNDSRRTPPPQE
jgi:hypothetical protein